MAIRTFHFNEGGCIPGIPLNDLPHGYPGMQVDVDSETGQIVEIRHPDFAPLNVDKEESAALIIDTIEPIENQKYE
jgi:hypothetical protein